MKTARHHGTILAAAAVVLLWTGAAQAQIPPVQWQIAAIGTTDVALEDVGGEIQVNLAIYGIGLALGLGGEALAVGDQWRGAGFLDIAIQLRPMMMAASFREPWRPVYHVFDPHFDIGGLLGGISDEEGAAFRGVFYFGLSFDFGIPVTWYRMQSQILLSLGYRFVPVQTQEAATHLIVAGIGYRSGF